MVIVSNERLRSSLRPVDPIFKSRRWSQLCGGGCLGRVTGAIGHWMETFGGGVRTRIGICTMDNGLDI